MCFYQFLAPNFNPDVYVRVIYSFEVLPCVLSPPNNFSEHTEVVNVAGIRDDMFESTRYCTLLSVGSPRADDGIFMMF